LVGVLPGKGRPFTSHLGRLAQNSWANAVKLGNGGKVRVVVVWSREWVRAPAWAGACSFMDALLQVWK
jgi:hypothetical protein